MKQQPEALRLADALDCYDHEGMSKAATELRRLHSVNAEFLEALQAIANGTEFWDSYPLEHAYGKARAAIAKATGEKNGN
jgi:hypothetical protein